MISLDPNVPAPITTVAELIVCRLPSLSSADHMPLLPLLEKRRKKK